jgi:hypothetical protein
MLKENAVKIPPTMAQKILQAVNPATIPRNIETSRVNRPAIAPRIGRSSHIHQGNCPRHETMHPMSFIRKFIFHPPY